MHCRPSSFVFGGLAFQSRLPSLRVADLQTAVSDITISRLPAGWAVESDLYFGHIQPGKQHGPIPCECTMLSCGQFMHFISSLILDSSFPFAFSLLTRNLSPIRRKIVCG